MEDIDNNLQPQGTAPARETVPPKKILSRAGIALSIFAVVVLGVQSALEALVRHFKPELTDTSWYVWAVTAVSIVLIGFPIYALLMRYIPNSPKVSLSLKESLLPKDSLFSKGSLLPKVNLSPQESVLSKVGVLPEESAPAQITQRRPAPVILKPGSFFTFFFICTAAMYLTNMISVVLSMIIALIKGEGLVNPAADAILNGNFLITILYAGIIAPTVEELIFRKLLLDKLRRFGELPAILMTGLAFGLFHLNLSQFFYATVLGFIFAYITIRTNTVRYSILLHMMINIMSTLITPLVKGMSPVAMIFIFTWEIAAITIGVVLFIVNMKKIVLLKSEPVLKLSDYFTNVGTIFYLVICIIVIIIMTIM